MSNELDEILNLEPQRSVASVAPVAFFIGTAMGGILAVFATLYASYAIDVALPQSDANLFGRLFSGPSTRIVGQRTERPAGDRAATEAGVTDAPRADTGTGTVTDISFGDGELEASDIEVAELDAARTEGAAARSVEAPPAGILEQDAVRLRQRIQELEARLATATVERSRLRKEIAALTQDLRVTEGLLQNAREDAIYNRWMAFLEVAKSRICGQYGRARSDRCRAAVSTSLLTPSNRELFAYCLRSGQAEPYVDKLRRGVPKPPRGEMINEGERTTRGWAVVFCDEQLPIDPDGQLSERSP